MNNGITFIHLEETDSTNTYLKSYPKDPAQPYVSVMADYQTAGRGQRGNTWHSARGQNLLCSIRHHPTFLRPQQQFILSQLIALTITDSLSELLPDADEHLRIKWPNDIYWDDRKLCGILIEYELSATSIEQAIIGFGVNVNQTDFGSAPGDTTLRLPGRDIIGATYRPTSLRLITGKDFDVPTLFYTLTRRYITTLTTLFREQRTENRRSCENQGGDATCRVSTSGRVATDEGVANREQINVKEPQTEVSSDHCSLFTDHSSLPTAHCSLFTDHCSLESLNLRYARRLYRLGTPARYRDAEGDFTATIEGVNPDGTLRLRLPDGTLRHYEFKQVAYLF